MNNLRRLVLVIMTSLKKNILYSGLLTTANYIFPLITYPYVSRVLGVANIGVCNFVDSIINYFLLFSTLGIGIVGIREIAQCKGNKEELQNTFSKLFTLNTITTTVVLLVLLIAMYSVPRLYENITLMWIGVLKLIFNYLLIEWFYKGLEDFKYITNRTILIRSLYVLCVFLFVKSTEDVVLYFFLTTATIIVNALINILYAHKYVTIQFTFSSLKECWKSVAILGVYNLLTSMYTTFNVIYLGFVSTDTQVGYYTTSTKIHSIILMAFTAVTSVLMPRMAAILAEQKYDDFKRFIKKSVSILLIFAIPCVIIIELFAPLIIHIIAGNGYEGAITPLRIIAPLVLVIGLEQILIQQSLMPMGKDKAILINSILGALVGILANVVLVPYLASIGSAIVWLLSEFIVMCSALYFVRKEWRILGQR